MASQEEVYQLYHDYDWNSFQEFQDGLREILGGYLENLKEQDPSVTNVPALERQQLTDQAKSFFFSTQTGHILNLDDYKEWESNTRKQLQISEALKNVDEEIQEYKTAESDSTPYSNNYQQLVEMLLSGKEVPGIKQIPDTVLTDKSSEAILPKRKKPWES